jgi:hypothetical protein
MLVNRSREELIYVAKEFKWEGQKAKRKREELPGE